MDALLHDLAAHNIQNRTVGFIQNGTWAATTAKQMRELLSGCKNMTFLENTVSLKSSLKDAQLADINALASEIAASFSK